MIRKKTSRVGSVAKKKILHKKLVGVAIFCGRRLFKENNRGSWKHPFEKYAPQVGSFPQVGVNIQTI